MVGPLQFRLDNLSTSVAVKAPVKAVATVNVATLAGHQTIGAVAVITGDRVLLTAQTAGADNGIYVVDTSAWSRAQDFEGNRDVVGGTLIIVQRTSADDVLYQVSNVGSIAIGTTALTFNLIGGETSGTWEPGIAFGGASASVAYDFQEGRYVKRGTVVYFEGRFLLSSKGVSTGAVTITGLPFTSALNKPNGALVIGRRVGLSTLAHGYVQEADTVINLYLSAGGDLLDGAVGATSELQFSGHYTVDP